VAKGPGGFSALRVGVGVAKGMAESLDIPLVSVSTLEIEAFPYAYLRLPIYPLLPAGRSDVAWAVYQRDDYGWGAIHSEEISNIGAFIESSGTPGVFCGEAIWNIGDEIRSAKGKDALVMTIQPPTRRATTLSFLGAERLSKGMIEDRETFQPLYIRRPSITLPKKRGN